MSAFAGSAVNTKNALRTFLTSSSDFSLDRATHQRDTSAAVAHSTSPCVISSTGALLPTLSASITAMRSTPRESADHHEPRPPVTTDVAAVRSVPASHVETPVSVQRSPKQPAACLPSAAAVFSTITDIARFGINSTGHPPLAVPLLVEPGIHGARPIFGTLAVTSVPQASTSLGPVVLPAGFVAAGSALRLPLAPVPRAVSMVTTAGALGHGSNVEPSQVGATTTDGATGSRFDQHHDPSSALNWKLKMARDHVSSCLHRHAVIWVTQTDPQKIGSLVDKILV